MIHEAEDSVSISADRTAFIWEVRHREAEHRQAEEKTIRQQDFISCHSRKVDIADIDLIL